MQNNIQEDLRIFNELIEEFLREEKNNPISDAILTKFTASYFLLSSFVTPTATPTLPSKVEKPTTIPSLISLP